MIQSFSPFRTQRSPFGAAVVASAKASEPEPASESAYDATFCFASWGKYFFWIAGEAQRLIALFTSVFWTSTTTAQAASTRASASMIAIDVVKFAPRPPNSSGISIPMRSRSKNFRMRSGSITLSRSIRADCGRDRLDREIVDALGELPLVVPEDGDRRNRGRFCGEGHRENPPGP